MARNQFSENTWYAANLREVSKRPIANCPSNGNLHLIRLEFEIYEIYENRGMLISRGELASQDVIIGDFIDPAKDAGILQFSSVLGLRKPQDLNSWLSLCRNKIWLKLKFAEVDSESIGRNPFACFGRFAPGKYEIKKFAFDLTKKWVRVKHAAEIMNKSESTIRRRCNAWEAKGYPVTRRTKGNHREINMPLLHNLEPDENR